MKGKKNKEGPFLIYNPSIRYNTHTLECIYIALKYVTKKWQLKELFTIIVNDLNCPLANDSVSRKNISREIGVLSNLVSNLDVRDTESCP